MSNERNFILQSFGLTNVKSLIYPGGKQLPPGHTDFDSVTKRDIADTDYNMTTLETGKAPVSMLGTPVFADLTLEGEGTKLHLTWALLEVNQTKNIVKTAVEGRDGTVKEYVSDGDYLVTIRGGLFSEFSYAYPKDSVQTLLELMKLNVSLKVVSEYLRMFDIHSLVVDSYTLQQREGVQNVQLFEIKALSDLPIELSVK